MQFAKSSKEIQESVVERSVNRAKATYSKVITAGLWQVTQNIQNSFAGAGLAQYTPERVLSKLTIQLKTPSPPGVEKAIL